MKRYQWLDQLTAEDILVVLQKRVDGSVRGCPPLFSACQR